MPVQARSAGAPEAARTAADLYPAMSQDIVCLTRRLPALAGSLVVHAILIAGMGLVTAQPQFAPLCEFEEAAWAPYEVPGRLRARSDPSSPPRPVPVEEIFGADLALPLAWEEELPEDDLALERPRLALLRPDLIAFMPSFEAGAETSETSGLPPWWSLFVPLGR